MILGKCDVRRFVHTANCGPKLNNNMIMFGSRLLGASTSYLFTYSVSEFFVHTPSTVARLFIFCIFGYDFPDRLTVRVCVQEECH